VADVQPMLELHSLVDGRSVYFHPPSAAILTYDRPQEDDTLVNAHRILQRHPTAVAGVTADQKIDSIEYYATGACNLRCGYCYLGPLADHPEPMDLNPIGFLERIEKLLEAGRIAPRLRIAIIGGEPLLAFQGLRQIVGRVETMAESHGVEVSFGVTTNGHLLGKEMADFLRAHDVAVKISRDGRHEARNRPAKTRGAAPDWNTLPGLRQLTDGLSVTLNATLRPPQFESQGEVFAELVESGFSRVQISVANGFSWTAADLRRFFRGLCSLTWEAQRNVLHEVQQAQIIDILRGYKLRRSHCGAGISHLALDAAGNIEACSTSFNHDGHGRHSEYGLYDVESDEACRSCAFRYGCGGGCRAFRHDAHPCITDCAPIYLRFVLAMGLVADLPGFRSQAGQRQ
jgi:uncharacterized protein